MVKAVVVGLVCVLVEAEGWGWHEEMGEEFFSCLSP